jgi:hypothetical protein
VTRFGGWLIMRRWFAAFRKDPFSDKLAEAKRILSRSLPPSAETRPSQS